METNLKKPLAIIIAAIIVVLAVSGLTYYLHKNHQTQYLYSYKNSRLITSSIKGDGPSSGAIFQYPKEFSQLEPLDKPNVANFAHDINRKGVSNTIAGEAIASAIAPNNYELLLASYFTLPQNSSTYQNTLAPAKSFINYNIGYLFFFDDKNPKLSLKLDRPSQFMGANLRKGAWLINYTAADTNLVNNKQKVSYIKGQLLLAVGAQRQYYLLVGSADYNWSSNQTTWNAIVASFRVDQ